MKKITFLFAFLFSALCFSQNQSFGSVQSSIFTPIPQQFSGGEIFRFRPGLMTQLDSGTDFGFTNSRWFSIGRLNTGSQTVYGLRFQLPNRALTMGYQDLNDANPRIQWIGASSFAGTDLEFRAANSFTSTSSTLVATMTNDGNTFFGTPLTTSTTKVGIDFTDIGSTRTGLTTENNTTSSGTVTGLKSVNNFSCYVKTGLQVTSSGGAYGDTGVSVSLRDGFYSSGVSAFVTSNGGYTYGVRGSITLPSGITTNNFGAGIYGSSAAVSNRFAGYFDGNVTVNGIFTSSDEKLKEEIKNEEAILDRIMELNAVTYKFKENDQLNLPEELQHGFLAQNIEEVFPELVTTIRKPVIDKENKIAGEYEYKAVNYIGLISILTSSIQELNEKVATLESEREENVSKTTITEVGFSMEQNKPNPFTNQTVVNYTLPSNTKATIAVVDLSGKFIREYDLSSEKGQLIINSSDIGKGIFIYTLISDNEVIISKKMIIR